jgi:hypothetical protein
MPEEKLGILAILWDTFAQNPLGKSYSPYEENTKKAIFSCGVRSATMLLRSATMLLRTAARRDPEDVVALANLLLQELDEFDLSLQPKKPK